MPTKLRNGVAQQATKVKSKINQSESLQLSKTFVHTSIGSLACLRDLFPQECYGEYHYDVSKGVIDYENFAQGNRDNINKAGHGMRVIKRGVVAKVDSFLDTLENGVFNILDRGWLEALDLIITSSDSLPLKVLEKYTYHFHYGESKVHAVTIPGYGNVAMSLDTIRRDMRAVVKRIIELDRVLPRLPATRYLVIQVHYTDDAPDEFNPPGFHDTWHQLLRINNSNGWKSADINFGSIITGEHSVALVGSILENDKDEACVPDNLAFEVVPNNSVSPFHGSNSNAFGEKRALGNATAIMSDSQPVNHAALETSQLLPADEQETTRQQLQAMQTAVSASQPEVNTQIVTQNEAEETQDFVQRLGTRKSASFRVEYIHQLERLRQRGDRETSPSKCEVVSCQCGWHEEDGEMIQCYYCGHWQHAVCYGYAQQQDSSIPEVFACNTCLFKVSRQQASGDLRELAFLRNAIHILLTAGYVGDEEFRVILHCDASITPTIIDKLVSEGLLTKTRKSRSGSTKHQRSYTVVRDNVAKSRIANMYFDPTRYIELFFENEENHNKLDNDLESMQTFDLDPCLSSQSANNENDAVIWTPRMLHSSKRLLDIDDEAAEGREEKRRRVGAAKRIINVAVKSPSVYTTDHPLRL